MEKTQIGGAFKIRLAEDLMAIELEDRMSDDDDGHPRKREPLPGEHFSICSC